MDSQPPAPSPDPETRRGLPRSQSPRPSTASHSSSSEGGKSPAKRLPPSPVYKARLCVVESVYHQHPDQSPVVSETRYHQFLDTDEQAWVRSPAVVGGEWVKLESGWISGASMLCLKCLEGHLVYGIQCGPTVAPVSEIPPGLSIRLMPWRLEDCRIKGPGKFALMLTPE